MKFKQMKSGVKYNLVERTQRIYADSRRPNGRKPLVVLTKNKVIGFAMLLEWKTNSDTAVAEAS